MYLSRRSLVGLVLTAGLLAAVAPSTLAAAPSSGSAHARLSAPTLPAAGPAAASAPSGSLKANLAALARQAAGSPFKATTIDSANLPAAVRSAVALQKSLSASQKRQLAVAVARFDSSFKGIAARMPAPSASTNGKTPDARAQASALAALSAQVDRQVKGILSTRQYALHVAATSPARATAAPGAQGASTSAAAPKSLSTTCIYAGEYATYALLWEYYANLYSYYNYVTYGSGTYGYGYYGYVYAYYAYYYYGIAATEWLSAAYFDAVEWGFDWLNNGPYGVSYAGASYSDAYYAELYDYYSYYNEGTHTYAYYGYYYSYYAEYYMYYAWLYGYYYCE